MNITIISSSTRANSRSRDVSDYIGVQLAGQGANTSVIDLHELALPVFDSTSEGDYMVALEAALHTLKESDGFVFVSPEWGGMMSPGLHNFFYYLGQELADKPVYLVGVSSGRGGRYPLLQMRQMGYKNKHFVIIPESIFFDYVNESLVDGELKNEHIEKRLQYGLKTLRVYAEALKQVRESGVTDYQEFKNGW